MSALGPTPAPFSRLPHEVFVLIWRQLDYDSLLLFVESVSMAYTDLITIFTDVKADLKRLRHVATLNITLIKDIKMKCFKPSQNLLTIIKVSNISKRFDYTQFIEALDIYYCNITISGFKQNRKKTTAVNCPVVSQLLSCRFLPPSTTRIVLKDFKELTLQDDMLASAWTLEMSNMKHLYLNLHRRIDSTVCLFGDVDTMTLLGSNKEGVFDSVDFSGLSCSSIELQGHFKQLRGKVFQCRELSTTDTAATTGCVSGIVGCTFLGTERLTIALRSGRFDILSNIHAPSLSSLEIRAPNQTPFINNLDVPRLRLFNLTTNDTLNFRNRNTADYKRFMQAVLRMTLEGHFDPLLYGPTRQLTVLRLIIDRDVPRMDAVTFPSLIDLELEFVMESRITSVPTIRAPNLEILSIVDKGQRILPLNAVDKMALRYQKLKSLSVWQTLIWEDRFRRLTIEDTFRRRCDQLESLTLRSMNIGFLWKDELFKMDKLKTLKLEDCSSTIDYIKHIRFRLVAPKLETLMVHTHHKYFALLSHDDSPRYTHRHFPNLKNVGVLSYRPGKGFGHIDSYHGLCNTNLGQGRGECGSTFTDFCNEKFNRSLYIQPASRLKRILTGTRKHLIPIYYLFSYATYYE